MTARVGRTDREMRPGRLGRALVAAAIALAAALALRFLAVEPRPVGLACLAAPETLPCRARMALVTLFQYDLPGWAALLAGAAAILTARPALAVAALALGPVALTLYDPALGAAGFLLGLVAALAAPEAGERR